MGFTQIPDGSSSELYMDIDVPCKTPDVPEAVEVRDITSFCFPKSSGKRIDSLALGGKSKPKQSFDYYESLESDRLIISRLRLWIYTLISAMVVGFLKGIVSLVFENLGGERLEEMSDLARSTGGVYASMGIMAVYGVICAFLASAGVLWVARSAGGGGLPDIRAFLNGNLLNDFLAPRTLFARVFGLCLVISSGVVAGPGGPFSHVGMIVCVLVPTYVHPSKLSAGQIFDFATIGAGMGIAAELRAPLTGTLFAVEMAASMWHADLIARTFLGSVIAATFGQYVTEGFKCESDTTYCVSVSGGFAFTTESLANSTFRPWEFPIFVLVGIGAAILSTCMCKILLFATRYRKKYAPSTKLYRQLECAAVFALTAVLFSLLTLAANCYPIAQLPVSESTESLTIAAALCPEGTYNPIALLLLEPRQYALKTLLSGSSVVNSPLSQFALWLSLLAAGLMLALTVGLPLPAGMIIPSIFVGAIFGRSIGELVYELSGVTTVTPGIYALAGGAGFLAGVSGMTVWVAALMTEGSSNVFAAIPIVSAVVAANLTASRLMGTSLFDKLIVGNKIKLLPPLEGTEVRKLLPDSKRIQDAMSTPVVAIVAGSSIDEITSLLDATEISSFPIVTPEGCVVGLVNREELRVDQPGTVWNQGDTLTHTKVPITVNQSASLRQAYYIFTQLGLDTLLVVDQRNMIQGILTRSDFSRILQTK